MTAVARALVCVCFMGAGIVFGLNWDDGSTAPTVTRYKVVPVRCSTRPPVGPLGPTGPREGGV